MERRWGAVRQLGSGRWQASYPGPDGKRHTARTDDDRPLTFTSRKLAEHWLIRTHAAIQEGRWTPAAKAGGAPTFRDYARAVMAERELATRSREHAEQLLRDHINPTFGSHPVTEITAPMVRTWFANLAHKTGPTARAHAYGTLRMVMQTAVSDELVAANPCRIRGAGKDRQEDAAGDAR
jgi:hypothetical protein